MRRNITNNNLVDVVHLDTSFNGVSNDNIIDDIWRKININAIEFLFPNITQVYFTHEA